MHRRKRSHSFHLRLSDAEYADLHAKAAKAGLGPQAYIHAVLKGKELREKPSMDLIDVLRNLSQIKNNLYVIAMDAQKSNEVDSAACRKVFDKVEAVLGELLTFMYGE